MATQSFKDLMAWQKASDLTVEIYQTFNNVKDYGFINKLQAKDG